MPTSPSVNDMLDELAGRVDQRIPPHPEVDDRVFGHLRLMLDEAAQHAHMGAELPERTRARPLKQALVDGLRPVTSYQRTFNARVLEVLETLTDLARLEAVVATDRAPVDAQLDRMHAAVATIDVGIDEVSEQVRALGARIAEYEQTATRAEPVAPPGRSEIQDLLDRLGELEAAVDRLGHRHGGDGERDRLQADLVEAFRGTRGDVRRMLEPYVDDVRRIGSDAPIVDVGCGRGEWLEILRDHGIAAYGIDRNPLLVAASVERGLDAREGDAVTHLAALPARSVAAVTGFHVAEHLELDDVSGLIEAALAALVPGGKLILETPNCTNLVVGASSFHLDPTHIRPLHPQLLEFLCRRHGFATVEIRYLHPRRTDRAGRPPEPPDPSVPLEPAEELEWSLHGPMDYAVVATSTGAG